ncbi:MAG: DinB family protein [Chloroflexi bacterium]|nr:DinB family protein [Chloroflexota bacterium]
MINLDTTLARLSADADTIASLSRGVTDAQARWKPSPDEWSILEVLCHLYDEEREDFRTRVDFTLHKPTEAWPPIDPAGWVTARGYNQREFGSSLEAFLRERRESLNWLMSLQNPDWNSTHQHPRIGAMMAGDVLAAWVAHDHLHIRQLNHLHWQHLSTQVKSISLDYAGGW